MSRSHKLALIVVLGLTLVAAGAVAGWSLWRDANTDSLLREGWDESSPDLWAARCEALREDPERIRKVVEDVSTWYEPMNPDIVVTYLEGKCK